MERKLRVHSIETSGFFDGPGIRTVIFFQGCNLRCQYCHNPDTWKMDAGEEYSLEEIMDIIEKYNNYYKVSGGGVTFSGGDPFCQIDFLIRLLEACKKKGIHTAIDTSGHFDLEDKKVEKAIALADLILLDIKGTNPEKYKEITRVEQKKFDRLIEYLNFYQKNVWLRYVLVPDLTDGEKEISELKKIMARFKHLVKIELLPFHQIGQFKYEELGIPYALKDHPEMDKEKALELEKELNKLIEI